MLCCLLFCCIMVLHTAHYSYTMFMLISLNGCQLPQKQKGIIFWSITDALWCGRCYRNQTLQNAKCKLKCFTGELCLSGPVAACEFLPLSLMTINNAAVICVCTCINCQVHNLITCLSCNKHIKSCSIHTQLPCFHPESSLFISNCLLIACCLILYWACLRVSICCSYFIPTGCQYVCNYPVFICIIVYLITIQYQGNTTQALW